MNVKVQLFGQLREVADIRQEEISLAEGTRLTGLIERLVERHGTAFAEKVGRPEGLRILVNGREHSLLNGVETELRDQDTVAFLSLITGG